MSTLKKIRVAVGACDNYGSIISELLDILVRKDNIELVGIDLKKSKGYKEKCVIKNIPKITYDEICENKFDIFFSFSYPKIIESKLLSSCRCINWHCAKLPEYKGRGMFTRAIQDGVMLYGTTFHLMEENLDSGNILSERLFPIEINDTAWTLREKSISLTKSMLNDCLDDLLDFNYFGRKQPKNNISPVFNRKFDGLIDLNQDPLSIWNKIRSLEHPNFEPAYLMLENKKIFITTKNVQFDVLKNKIEFLI